MLLALCLGMGWQLLHSGADAFSVHIFLLLNLGISLTFAGAVLALRAATPLAAFAGGAICLLVLLSTVGTRIDLLHSGLPPLLLLFVLTFAATKAGRRRKAQAGLAESRKGRNAAQVIANLGVAGVSAAFPCFLSSAPTAYLWELCGRACDTTRFIAPAFWAVLLAALCEATADTVSSEIGQAFGGRPILITSGRRVEPGTDGAITILGTLAGMLAAAMVALTGYLGLGIGPWIPLAAGIAGLLFDSLLGATVERKGWLGNDLVNFASTLFAAGLAILAVRP